MLWLRAQGDSRAWASCPRSWAQRVKPRWPLPHPTKLLAWEPRTSGPSALARESPPLHPFHLPLYLTCSYLLCPAGRSRLTPASRLAEPFSACPPTPTVATVVTVVYLLLTLCPSTWLKPAAPAGVHSTSDQWPANDTKNKAVLWDRGLASTATPHPGHLHCVFLPLTTALLKGRGYFAKINISDFGLPETWI